MSWCGNQPPRRQRVVGLQNHPSGSYTGGQAEVSPGSLVISQDDKMVGLLLKQTWNLIIVCRLECTIQGSVDSELCNQGNLEARLLCCCSDLLVLIEKESGGSPWQLERRLTMCLLVVNCSTEFKSIPQKVVHVYLESVNVILVGHRVFMDVIKLRRGHPRLAWALNPMWLMFS